ncbi:MAG: hypothetical protein JSW45_04590 [Thiotrichales bacterium]|nr:MAG: hypothetical protein JSW45_04590 [Thiotrichales bacterium]
MLYLDQPRNRRLFMAVSIISTVGLIAILVPGMNMVGIMMATATINIIAYYLLPDHYSRAYLERHPSRFDLLAAKAGGAE